MNIIGARRATTFPASIGLLWAVSLSRHMSLRAKTDAYFAPVLFTERSPPSFLAVTSHAMSEHMRPSIGDNAAAARFCCFHIRDNVAGRTAEEIITPIMRYRYPIEMPMSTIFSFAFPE